MRPAAKKHTHTDAVELSYIIDTPMQCGIISSTVVNSRRDIAHTHKNKQVFLGKGKSNLQEYSPTSFRKDRWLSMPWLALFTCLGKANLGALKHCTVSLFAS